MDDRPMDLRALDPDEDPWRRERVVGGAMLRIRALQREPAPAPAPGWLAWWRPALGFAVLVMAVSGGVLASAPQGGRGGSAGTAAAAGVPAPLAEWMASERLPSSAEVFAAVQGYP